MPGTTEPVKYLNQWGRGCGTSTVIENDMQLKVGVLSRMLNHQHSQHASTASQQTPTPLRWSVYSEYQCHWPSSWSLNSTDSTVICINMLTTKHSHVFVPFCFVSSIALFWVPLVAQSSWIDNIITVSPKAMVMTFKYCHLFLYITSTTTKGSCQQFVRI